jgi:hypothetical protein
VIKKFIITALIFLLALVGIALAQDSPRTSWQQIESRAASLLPDRSQLRFQEIPWVHELAEAQRVAQLELRPIFLWGYGGRGRSDNALEGC